MAKRRETLTKSEGVPYVLMRVVKGNLKHRIQKLGTEKDWLDLNPDQRLLRRIAIKQGVQSLIPERPSWANGAFLYLLPEHAREIQKVVEHQGVFLQSKHILVSPTLVNALELCLQAKPEQAGREAFLVSRAGMVQSEQRLLLLPFRAYVYNKTETATIPEQRTEISEEGSRLEKKKRCGSKEYWLRCLDGGVLDTIYSKLQQTSALTERIIGTLSFFGSPVSVQELECALHEEACAVSDDGDHPKDHLHHLWTLACLENSDVLEMTYDDKDRSKVSRPFCKTCQKVATKEHLNSRQHKLKVVNLKRKDGNIKNNVKVDAHEILLNEMLNKDIPAGNQLLTILAKSSSVTTHPTKRAETGAGVLQSGAEVRKSATPESLDRENKQSSIIEKHARTESDNLRSTENQVPALLFQAPFSSKWSITSKEFIPGALGHPGARFYGTTPPAPPPMPCFTGMQLQ